MEGQSIEKRHDRDADWHVYSVMGGTKKAACVSVAANPMLARMSIAALMMFERKKEA